MDLFFQEKEKTFSDSDFFQVMLLLRFYNNYDNNGNLCSVVKKKKHTEALQRGRLEIKVLV